MNSTKTFAHGVADTIKEYLPEEFSDYTITVEEKVKNNNVVHVGICVHAPDERISPVIYMESFFDEIKSGESVDHVMRNIAECIKECRNRQNVPKDFSFEDYNSVKENITPMLVNTKANRQLLMQVPHVEVEDLSIICKLDVPVDPQIGTAHTKVNYQLMEIWGVSKNELFDQAYENMQKKDAPVLSKMTDIFDAYYTDSSKLTNLLDGDKREKLDAKDMIYVLTNDSRNFGASAVTCPGVMEKMGGLLPQGYYVLPSSLHEVLIVPKSEDMDPKALGQMVRDVNRDVVDKEEVLSDRVYEYDKEHDRLKQVPESIQKERGFER